MTNNISQKVVPRHRRSFSCLTFATTAGGWNTKPLRQTRFFGNDNGVNFSRRFLQRGSVTQSTVTLAVAIIVIVGLSLLGFFYLQQVFGTAARGSDVQALQTKILELQDEQKSLELQGAELRSIQAVEQRVRKFDMVAAHDVAFLAPESGHVAMVNLPK